ncbi:murein hydrolase activator EnvC family protein [Paradesulfitobacterium ferrireducens]|uniref:murein hydrolase activator EnvC family protein n=1 Tax=Paradesulfitobacterium ferrireducens TaxID=2816476 RepID=UPI001A8F3161|nr:M23 family metallopeptidase [Paradesulfitobacterium ferrireducens]
MKKKFVAAVILSFILLSSSALPSRATEFEDALAQQKDIQAQKNQVQSKLNQLTFTADKIKAQMVELDAQTLLAQKDLKEKQEATKKIQAQLLTAQKELAAKQKEADERRQVLAARMRAIYEAAPVSYLEILFEATDLGDLITRFEYLSRLVENDQTLLEKTRAAVQEVNERTKKLQETQDQALQLEAQAQAAKTTLDNKLQQQKTLLAQVKKEQEAEWEEVEKLAAQEEAWQAKIRQLQAGSKSGGKSSTITTWPLPGYYEISSPFGWRINPVTKKRGQHLGIDIPAPSGTKILAAASGEVIFAGWDNVYGYFTIIDIGGGVTNTYGHQSKLGVSVGQRVEAGEVAGYVGNTGWSTGPHLDFGVRINGKAVDPLRYFR